MPWLHLLPFWLSFGVAICLHNNNQLWKWLDFAAILCSLDKLPNNIRHFYNDLPRLPQGVCACSLCKEICAYTTGIGEQQLVHRYYTAVGQRENGDTADLCSSGKCYWILRAKYFRAQCISIGVNGSCRGRDRELEQTLKKKAWEPMHNCVLIWELS